MIRKKELSLTVLMIAVIITFGGCGGSDDSAVTTRGELVSADLLQEVWGKPVSVDEKFFTDYTLSNNNIASLDAASFFYNLTNGELSDDMAGQYILSGVPAESAWQAVKLLEYILSGWSEIQPHTSYFPFSYNVTYNSINARGDKEVLTGRVIFPANLEKKTQGDKVPMLLLQHPTQVLRSQSPSRISYLPWDFNHDTQLTVTLGTVIAATGYIVVIPDYMGMGDNMSIHPYCHESLAYSVFDMVSATLKIYDDSSRLTGLIPWDKEKLFMMGFSEGGYATMVAAKEFQKSGKYPVSGAACLDGPYSLSGTISKLILNADKNFFSPYFLPYFLNGYSSVYASDYPEFSYTNAVRSDVKGYEGTKFAEDLAKLMNGSHQSEEINMLMRKAPAPETYAGPSSILSETFSKSLKDTESLISRKIKENDAFNWKPEMPLRMFHHPDDDIVPIGNMNEAYEYFINVAKASPALVSKETFTEKLDVPGQSMHENAYPFAFLRGFMWLNKIAYPSR